MFHNGTRRCDLCAAEILGRGGADICVVCRIAMEEDRGHDRQQYREVDRWEDTEGFALTAVVGRSHMAADLTAAANDDRGSEQLAIHRGRRKKIYARALRGPEGMVHRFAAGLRSISRRRLDERR